MDVIVIIAYAVGVFLLGVILGISIGLDASKEEVKTEVFTDEQEKRIEDIVYSTSVGLTLSCKECHKYLDGWNS